jgi:DNA-binding protein HU-beta
VSLTAKYIEKEQIQMTKNELVLTASGAVDIPPKAVEKALNAMVDTIIEAVASGEGIILPGFGTFSRKHRDARTCRNPQTGESMDVPAREVASFKPGKRLREAVNGG